MRMKHLRHRLNQQGLSIVELAITLAIVGILAAVVTPMFKAGPDRRLKAAARNLWADVRFVRMESVKRRTDIGIQFNTGAYAPGGRVGNYLIFVDDGAGVGGTAGDGIQTPGEVTIKTVPMPQDVSLITTNPAAAGITTIGYNSRALPNGINTGSIQMRNTRSCYMLTLSQAGSFRIRTAPAPCPDATLNAAWSEN